MKQKKNIFSRVFSMITYKEKKEVREFYIPEVNENQDTPENEVPYGYSPKDSASRDRIGRKNHKGMKKPTPISEINSEKSKNSVKASDKAVGTDIDSNMDFIRKRFNAPDNKDIVIRQFTVAGKYKAFISYLDGMVDKATINNFILRPLLTIDNLGEDEDTCQLDFIFDRVIETNQTKKVTVPNDMIFEILSGNTCLYVDGCSYYISCETKGFPSRGVEKPQMEGVVLGAQEAFNETLRTNITLVRKQIKNSNLTTEFFKVGNANQNQCAIMYIKGITNPAIVKEARRRLKNLNSDYIAGDGILEQYIEDSPWSLIPTTMTTERPDRTAAHILEGKVAIIADGTPFAKIVPTTIFALLHSPEDSYMRWQYGTFMRLIRLLSAFIAIFLPGLYVAMTSFHQEMIPTDLLIAIAKAKENVPFPTIVEVLLMEVSFELIREAGIRIPGIIGNTLGIIGALILGQAAVQANIVSPVLIIIVAVTGLGNFAIPNYKLAFAVRLMRFIFIISGSLLGFYGISVAFVILSALAVDMKSFGVPFFAPVAPKTSKSADILIRQPVWEQEFRPDYVNALDKRRQPKLSRGWAKQDAPVPDANAEAEAGEKTDNGDDKNA